MKKLKMLMLMGVVMTTLVACSNKVVEPKMEDLKSDVDGAMTDISIFADVDENYIEGALAIDSENYVDCSVKVASVGAVIDEYGVFHAESEDDAKVIKEDVDKYIEMKIKTWMGYIPQDLPKLENAYVKQKGKYVVYAVADETTREAVDKAFEGSFE